MNKASKKEGKKLKKMNTRTWHMAVSQQHLTCSFMPACLRCRTLVDTKVLLLHILCCSVQGRLKAVLLCLRYVDTMAFGAWFVLLGVQKKKSRFKNKRYVVRLCSLEVILLAELMLQLNNSFFSKKSTSPAVMFTWWLVLPRALTWTEKSACVANLPH